MNIKIGTKIKSLRKKADVTQDKLAEYLGITPQAISRWESETVYPDIEIIPSIANYFNVTTDELLGVDIMNKQEKINEIYKQVSENGSKGFIDENIEILRNAVNEFPNDYNLLSDLAYYLGSCNKREDTIKEAISINERILADCTDDHIRYGVIQKLAYDYNSIGEKEKAIKTANKLPYWALTSDRLLRDIYDGDDRISHLKYNIPHYCDEITSAIKLFAGTKYGYDTSIDGGKKRIELYKKAIKIYEIIFENGDYGFYNGRMKDLYLSAAQNYILINDFDSALDDLEKAADYAIAFDTMPEVFTHTSLLSENNKFSKAKNLGKVYDYNESYQILHNHLLANERFDPIRETERFKAVVAKLEQYAKKEE